MNKIQFTINGQPAEASPDTTIAAAILNSGVLHFRKSVSGESRAPLCGMGLCYECRVTIDGVLNEKSCQTSVRSGMEIKTNEGV